MMLAASYLFILLLKTDMKVSPAALWCDTTHLFWQAVVWNENDPKYWQKVARPPVP